MSGWVVPQWTETHQVSMRDWLAMNATESDIEHHQGPWDHSSGSEPKPARTREEARYKFADAMLAARQEGGAE